MKILIVRGYAKELKIENYNAQEVGLAKELVKNGWECDLLYYAKENKEIILEIEGKKIKIYYRKAIKLFNNAIYYNLFFNNFFKQYDYIQTNEYHQIMTGLLSLFFNNVLIYHGPYDESKKIKIYNKLYELLFKKIIAARAKIILTKSELGKKYLLEKNIKNTIETLGVGLNDYNFQLERLEIEKIEKIVLYVGELSDRKNIIFILKLFNNIFKTKDYRLVLIGKGKKEYIRQCKEYIKNNEILDKVIFIESLQQKELVNYYKKADIFLLPSKSEIFGMVLLEAMYFGNTIFSSYNGGSSTVIKDFKNGFIIKKMCLKEWEIKINSYLELKSEEKINIKKMAASSIKNKFLWNKLAIRYMNIIEKI